MRRFLVQERNRGTTELVRGSSNAQQQPHREAQLDVYYEVVEAVERRVDLYAAQATSSSTASGIWRPEDPLCGSPVVAE